MAYLVKKIDVPFKSKAEVRDFEKYLEDYGKARGPWVRLLILNAMAIDRAIDRNAGVEK